MGIAVSSSSTLTQTAASVSIPAQEASVQSEREDAAVTGNAAAGETADAQAVQGNSEDYQARIEYLQEKIKKLKLEMIKLQVENRKKNAAQINHLEEQISALENQIVNLAAASASSGQNDSSAGTDSAYSVQISEQGQAANSASNDAPAIAAEGSTGSMSNTVDITA